jgi:F plasmid transfer operon, TraF, protein
MHEKSSTSETLQPVSHRSRLVSIYIALFLVLAASASLVHAAPVYLSPGPNLTYGNVSHGQGIASSSANPASPSANQSRGGEFAKHNGMLAVGAGIEYGGVNNLFRFIDQTSDSISPTSPPPSGGTPPDPPEEDGKLKQALDSLVSNNPNVEEAIAQITNKAATLAGSLLVIASKGYGKAYVTGDAPFSISTPVYGGTISVSASVSATSKVAGIADPLKIDPAQIRAQVEAAAQLPDSAPETDFELSKDIIMSIDPSSDKVSLKFNNDSLLLTKAAKIEEFSIGYSRSVADFESGKLFLGVKPKYIRAGLTRVGVRFGDISDSESLFEDIKNAEFRYDDELSVDLGAMWISDYYQVGGSVTNINQPKFAFPTIDTSGIENQGILAAIANDSIYKMEAQFKFEAGLHSVDKKWILNTAIDLSPAADPMGDNYQWASVSAGYATDSWWLPGIRTGLQSNLAGTQLTYISAGLTLFKYLDIDVSSALDTVEIDGEDLPRGLNLSLALSARF